MVQEYCAGFCKSGSHEGVKCAVHASAGVIAGVMAAYNIAACFFRRDYHLKVNAVVYTLAVAWEIKQTLHHLERCDPVTLPAQESADVPVKAA